MIERSRYKRKEEEGEEQRRGSERKEDKESDLGRRGQGDRKQVCVGGGMDSRSEEASKAECPVDLKERKRGTRGERMAPAPTCVGDCDRRVGKRTGKTTARLRRGTVGLDKGGWSPQTMRAARNSDCQGDRGS